MKYREFCKAIFLGMIQQIQTRKNAYEHVFGNALFSSLPFCFLIKQLLYQGGSNE